MKRSLDREILRESLRTVSDEGRRLILERAVEFLSEADLRRLLADIVDLEEATTEAQVRPASLAERVAFHVAATRVGAFLGRYEMNNRHGQREPAETTAWLAATSHLFYLLLAGDLGPEERASLRALVALVAEVDERVEELIVFEDSAARYELGVELDRALKALGTTR